MSLKVRIFEPGKGYLKIKDEIDSEIQRVLSAGDLILRVDVDTFEKNFAKYIGTRYCVALNSCTDALYLALRALKIGPGDEVLVPSRTFVATPQVIVQVGATPVFYDLDYSFPACGNVKAIMPVHIEGVFDKNALRTGLPVIEDAAQALGTIYEGKKAGSFGIAGCFSFYPAKILGAYGDAGALVTNDKDIYEWVRDARNHFKETNADWGVNSRLDNLQAAILNVKFKYLPEILKIRQNIAEMYNIYLNNTDDLIKPRNTSGRVWQDYIIQTSRRNELYEYLKEHGIETLKNNYPFPVPKLPQAQEYEDETLRLPCNENLIETEILYVIEKINDFYKK